MKKIVLLLIIVSCLCVAQETPLHKKISVDYQGIQLSDVLKDIGKKSGVRIAFAEKLVEHAGLITFKSKDQEAGRILSKILLPRGLKLSSYKGKLLAAVTKEPGEQVRAMREQDFKFESKPEVKRRGDTITLRFETEGFPDCTVAVEGNNGKIIRHLACGVLGVNAPEPFVWNSRKQVIIWDGKDDQGRYVDDKDSIAIRVSLGLKAQYERNLMWCPKKRGPTVGGKFGINPALMAPGPEGVYVFDGHFAGEHVRLYDHKGNYVRTVYPFPRDKVKKVKGLKMVPGTSYPLRWHQELVTMLTTGYSGYGVAWPVHMGAHHYGLPPSALAVRGKRLMLAGWRINRLATDGSSGGLELSGPGVTYKAKLRALHEFRGGVFPISPRSAVIDPKGEWIYLTGYAWHKPWNQDGLHGVVRVRVDGKGEPELFAGDMKQGKAGRNDKHLCYPLSAACDAAGRVYICDYMNDRIQIFSSSGKLLKTVRTHKPVHLDIHPETGELFIFSWVVGNDHMVREIARLAKQHKSMKPIPPTLTRCKAVDWSKGEKEINPKVIASYPLPLPNIRSTSRPSHGSIRTGLEHRAAVDFWSPEPTVWISEGVRKRVSWDGNIRMYALKDKKLELIRAFSDDVKKGDPQPRPPYHGRQRLYFDHKNGKLYVGEQFPDPLHIKSFWQMIQLDPETGKGKIVALPFDCEDMAFDMEGNAYLRTLTQIVRYEAETWREVPFDYGEEKEKLSYSRARSGRHAPKVISAIECRLESNSSSQFYGMWVSPKKHVVITGCHRSPPGTRRDEKVMNASETERYEPKIYSGRPWGSLVHIFDKHGNPVLDDALPGSNYFQGIAMDKKGSLYIQHSGMPPAVNGKYPPNLYRNACTLIKLKPKSRFLTPVGGIIPLAEGAKPKRPADFLWQGSRPVWIEWAEWMYGGVGLSTKASPGGKCHCFGNSRFGFDYFDRSFVSELEKYRLTVLDTNGNIILRIGKYGNADDGIPMRIPDTGYRNGKAPRSELRVPRSIGGDEVALMQALYLAVQTDQRLFVADIGNYRIFSIKLGYHAEEKVALKEVPDK